MNAGRRSLGGLEANLARAGAYWSSSADALGERRAHGFRDVVAQLLDQPRLTEDRRVGRAPRPDRIVSALLGGPREIDLGTLAGPVTRHGRQTIPGMHAASPTPP